MKPAESGLPQRADLHMHILPGLDDGAQTDAEALAMLRRLCVQRVTHAVATPHYIPGIQWSGREYLQRVNAAMERLRGMLDQEALPLTLLKGFEVRAGEALLYADELPELLIGGTPYLLLEVPLAGDVPWLEELLYSLRVWGIRPILAHPERCSCFTDRFSRLEQAVLGGAQAQINLCSLTGSYGSTSRRIAIRMLRSGLAAYACSDAHSEAGCAACDAAVGQVLRHARRGQAQAILRDNALRALSTAREGSGIPGEGALRHGDPASRPYFA